MNDHVCGSFEVLKTYLRDIKREIQDFYVSFG